MHEAMVNDWNSFDRTKKNRKEKSLLASMPQRLAYMVWDTRMFAILLKMYDRGNIKSKIHSIRLSIIEICMVVEPWSKVFHWRKAQCPRNEWDIITSWCGLKQPLPQESQAHGWFEYTFNTCTYRTLPNVYTVHIFIECGWMNEPSVHMLASVRLTDVHSILNTVIFLKLYSFRM